MEGLKLLWSIEIQKEIMRFLFFMAWECVTPVSGAQWSPITHRQVNNKDKSVNLGDMYL
jgi:hypothetical protein